MFDGVQEFSGDADGCIVGLNVRNGSAVLPFTVVRWTLRNRLAAH